VLNLIAVPFAVLECDRGWSIDYMLSLLFRQYEFDPSLLKPQASPLLTIAQRL